MRKSKKDVIGILGFSLEKKHPGYFTNQEVWAFLFLLPKEVRDAGIVMGMRCQTKYSTMAEVLAGWLSLGFLPGQVYNLVVSAIDHGDDLACDHFRRFLAGIRIRDIIWKAVNHFRKQVKVICHKGELLHEGFFVVVFHDEDQISPGENFPGNRPRFVEC